MLIIPLLIELSLVGLLIFLGGVVLAYLFPENNS